MTFSLTVFLVFPDAAFTRSQPWKCALLWPSNIEVRSLKEEIKTGQCPWNYWLRVWNMTRLGRFDTFSETRAWSRFTHTQSLLPVVSRPYPSSLHHCPSECHPQRPHAHHTLSMCSCRCILVAFKHWGMMSQQQMGRPPLAHTKWLLPSDGIKRKGV